MVCFVILITLSVLFFIISVCAASVQIPLSDIWRQFRGEQDEHYAAILFQIRIPRSFAAILLGGALALSGYLLQTFFHNPIAGPFVLGISSGAKLVVAMTMIICLQRGVALNSAGMVIAAFAGSLIAMGFVLLISFRVSKMSLLVVCGMFLCSCVIIDLIERPFAFHPGEIDAMVLTHAHIDHSGLIT